jgi:hypothetical protein
MLIIRGAVPAVAHARRDAGHDKRDRYLGI